MIRGARALDPYVAGLAKALYTRGFDLPAGPVVDRDSAGAMTFSVVGMLDELGAVTEISLDESWLPVGEGSWQRAEYTYDLVDRSRSRRRAFHMHDREAAEARYGTPIHEHCEEVLGAPACAHYIGRALPNGYVAIELLMAAWLEPGDLECDALTCLD